MIAHRSLVPGTLLPHPPTPPRQINGENLSRLLRYFFLSFFPDFPGAESFRGDGEALLRPPLRLLHRHAHPL